MTQKDAFVPPFSKGDTGGFRSRHQSQPLHSSGNRSKRQAKNGDGENYRLIHSVPLFHGIYFVAGATLGGRLPLPAWRGTGSDIGD